MGSYGDYANIGWNTWLRLRDYKRRARWLSTDLVRVSLAMEKSPPVAIESPYPDGGVLID